MRPYDPNQNYFGAKDTKLEKILAEILKNMPAIRDGWNEAAYRHDLAYCGKRRTGFFGWIKDAIERRGADLQFRDELLSEVEDAERTGRLSTTCADRAADLAEVAYAAVRVGGVLHYKKGY